MWKVSRSGTAAPSADAYERLIRAGKLPKLIACRGCLDRDTGRKYGLIFVFDTPEAPYLRISTEKRSDFLGKGTEQEAENGLIRLSLRIRAITGGYFSIHPFFGAVYGTKISQVSPGFLAELTDYDEELHMLLYLRNPAPLNPAVTKINKALPPGVGVDRAAAGPFRKTSGMEGEGGNLDQNSRDQAALNGFEEAWNAQFRIYNPHCPSSGTTLLGRWGAWLLRRDGIPRAMKVTPYGVTVAMADIETKLNLSLGEIRIVD